MGRHEQAQEQSPCLQQFSFSFTSTTCAFQTDLASQKSVSPSPPLFSSDMQTGYQPPRQLLCLLGEVLRGSDEAGAEVNRAEVLGSQLITFDYIWVICLKRNSTGENSELVNM